MTHDGGYSHSRVVVVEGCSISLPVFGCFQHLAACIPKRIDCFYSDNCKTGRV